MNLLTIQLITEITNAPITALVNDVTVKPLIICPTNQKNAPFMMSEKRPNVRIFIGSVRILMIGPTTILRNASVAATMTAVSTEPTVIPDTKYGSANIASVVMNQRSKIMILVYSFKIILQ